MVIDLRSLVSNVVQECVQRTIFYEQIHNFGPNLTGRTAFWMLLRTHSFWVFLNTAFHVHKTVEGAKKALKKKPLNLTNQKLVALQNTQSEPEYE